MPWLVTSQFLRCRSKEVLTQDESLPKESTGRICQDSSGPVGSSVSAPAWADSFIFVSDFFGLYSRWRVVALVVAPGQFGITVGFKSMFTDVTRMTAEKSDDVPDGYNTEQTRATRLTPDTETAYLRYRNEHDISDAEALRRLVREALDDTDETLNTLNKTALVAGAAYIAVIVFATIEAAAAVAGAYIAFLIFWSSFPHLTD